MTDRLSDLKADRLGKLKKIRLLGIDPYPARCQREQTIIDALKMMGEKVAVAGRIIAIRGHGGIQFFDLQDESGKIQLVFKSDKISEEKFKFLELLDTGDFLDVQGKIFKTEAGEISVLVQDFQIITKSLLPLPDQWYGLKDIEERYRKRYLDTILNPEVKARLKTRSIIIKTLRDFLESRGFLEVETPTLQAVYGGGFARPFVTHHNVLDADFYLRISDEMYLKRLIVGGFDKVFEITKVFRNEGIDRNHNPEFTMFEAMIAYKDYQYGMDLIEEIIEDITDKTLGKTKISYQGQEIDFKRPWKRYKLAEAVKEFAGVDSLRWKTVVEAKETVVNTVVNKGKLGELSHLHSLGEITAFLFEETVEGKLIEPTIIYDYPVEVSPLAKKCADERFTQRFEMFAMGMELGNNYTELNDPIDLRKRFIEEKKKEEAGFEEAQQTDNDYLTAIEHGFPPTCGIAIGIDRLAMILTDAPSLKEIIPFPTLKPEK